MVFHELKMIARFPLEIIPAKIKNISIGNMEQIPNIMVCTMELSCSTRANMPFTLDDRTSIASPTMMAMKISCRTFPVINGSNKFEGMMS